MSLKRILAKSAFFRINVPAAYILNTKNYCTSEFNKSKTTNSFINDSGFMFYRNDCGPYPRILDSSIADRYIT